MMMMSPNNKKILIILLLLCLINIVLCCRKRPSVPHNRKSTGDNGYRLYLGDEPSGYQPGKTYNLFLLGSRTHSNLQQFSHFMITAQSINGSTIRTASPKRVGRFQLFSDSLATFNENCVNTISETDDLPKTEIQVMWVAPATGSGCVALSALVYESPNSWYAEEGHLMNIICEKAPERKLNADECCACDEAKYNFVFEGIWSNETHPRDYPFAIWLTHFADVIGATHDSKFSFWGENHIASDGFRSMAEWGSVRLLEIELRAKAPRLKSLFKAAGLWYPDVNTNTSSHFKVDRKKHKLSLVSMFGPSPDWVVGVSGLDLCKSDCTWEESLDIDLFPWDAGTDNGISYMSPNSETQPRERMYPITNMYPEDPRQPFYNPDEIDMVPLAKLYIRRERIIAKNCDDDFLQSQLLDDSENSEGPVRPECEVTEYTSWSPCSVTCGKGIRSRSRQYQNNQLAASSGCNRQLISKEMCVSDIAECPNSGEGSDIDVDLTEGAGLTDDNGEGIGVCRTTVWSPWSECSSSCGAGISMRTRTFLDNAGRKKCPHVTTVEKEKCMAPDCLAADIEIPDSMCPVTAWSDWSPCSVTCGNGVQIRTRLLLVEPEKRDICSTRVILNEQRLCTVQIECVFNAENAREICNMEPEIGPCRGIYPRFYFSPQENRCMEFTFGGCRGNRNNFLTNNECMQSCESIRNQVQQNEPQDCIMSPWSRWSACNVQCGFGRSFAQRTILRPANNGGLPCGIRIKNRACEKSCPSS